MYMNDYEFVRGFFRKRFKSEVMIPFIGPFEICSKTNEIKINLCNLVRIVRFRVLIARLFILRIENIVA